MLSSINLEIYISLWNLSQMERKFANYGNFLPILTRSHQCLAQIRLEITFYLSNLSQINRKFATCSNFLAILTRIHQCLAQIRLEITFYLSFWAKTTENLHLDSIFWQFSRESTKKINMLSSIKLEITDVSTNFEP